MADPQKFLVKGAIHIWIAPSFQDVKNCGSSAFLIIGCAPAPSARPKATGNNPLAINARHNITVSSQKRLSGTHLGTDWQFAFCDPVAAILCKLGCGVVFLWTTSAEGTFVHLAAGAKVARLWELWCTEGACIKAIPTTNAQILRV